jgi:hypothetical protein
VIGPKVVEIDGAELGVLGEIGDGVAELQRSTCIRGYASTAPPASGAALRSRFGGSSQQKGRAAPEEGPVRGVAFAFFGGPKVAGS